MAKAARVIRDTLLATGRFDLTRTEIEVIEDDGSTRTLKHEVYRHGKAAAVLLYDAKRRRRHAGQAVSRRRVSQRRSAGDDRGLRRDAGRRSAGGLRRPRGARGDGHRHSRARPRLRRLYEPGRHDARRSPASSLLTAKRTAPERGGGVDEDEHIEVLEIPFGEALTMIERGAIADAKTIALLYYARAKGLMD